MLKKLTPVLIFAVLIGMLPFYISWIEFSGSVIHRGDIFSDYYWGCVIALFIGTSIIFWPIPSKDKVPLINIWVIKMAVVLGAMLIYEYKFGLQGLDAFNYYAQSKLAPFSWQAFEFGVGSNNIINLARLYQTVLPDSYHGMKVIWALVGFISVYFIYVAAAKIYPREDFRVLYTLMLFPSILFWSSILGKDPINLFGISIYVLGVVGLYVERNLLYLILVGLGIFLAAYIRFWYGVILTIPLMALVLAYPFNAFVRIGFLAILLLTINMSLGNFTSNYNITNLAELVFVSDSISQSWARVGGSGQIIEGGLGSVEATIRFIPVGAFTALFRPLPGEVMSLFGLLSGLENFVLIVLVIVAISRTNYKELFHPVLLWAMLFVITWSIFYSVASYQNLGTAVRFRLQILPVMLLLLLYLARPRAEQADSETLEAVNEGVKKE